MLTFESVCVSRPHNQPHRKRTDRKYTGKKKGEREIFSSGIKKECISTYLNTYFILKAVEVKG